MATHVVLVKPAEVYETAAGPRLMHPGVEVVATADVLTKLSDGYLLKPFHPFRPEGTEQCPRCTFRGHDAKQMADHLVRYH